MIFKKKQEKPLSLYWWRHPDSINGNFGDEITQHLINKLYGRKVNWSPRESCEIVGAGSILEHVININKARPYIWGSGFIENSELALDCDKYQVVGVRGKSTLSRVVNMPKGHQITLGDPGLLADSIIKPRYIRKKYKIGIIPHFYDLDNPDINAYSEFKGVTIINPLGDCIDVLRQIASCKVVVSSSLHGLIVADSFGIPNVHLMASDKLEGGLYKFNDYYSVYEKERRVTIGPEIFKKNVKEVKKLIKESYIRPADIDVIKNNIKKSFPY